MAVDPFSPTSFTPFLRRFTDERSRDLAGLKALYREVRALHLASKYAKEGAVISILSPIYIDVGNRLPEGLTMPCAKALRDLAYQETAIFSFPELKWDIGQLSLKEQVDLERFLTSKRHFLTNQDRVIDFLQGGLFRLFDAATRELPQFSETSPFNIPFIYVLPDPKKLLDSFYGILWTKAYIDNGLFVEVSTRMHMNICAVSGISDLYEPKKPFKLPSGNDAPLDEIVEGYFRGTPLYDFLLTPVPLRLTYEDRFSHILAENIEPVRDICRMVRPRFIRDPERATQERRAKLRNQLFERIVRIPEAFAEGATDTMVCAAPMGELVQEDGVIGFGRGAGRRAPECFPPRHVYIVGLAAVAGDSRAVPHLGLGRHDERFDLGVCLYFGTPLRLRQLPALDLLGVEHMR
jgi:hypothetical protein